MEAVASNQCTAMQEQHMVTLDTQFEVPLAPANISAREVFILPVSSQSNEDIKTTACW